LQLSASVLQTYFNAERALITALLPLLLAVSPSCPPTESDITWTLVVQAIDRLWHPIPDASVVVKSKTEEARSWQGATNKRGFACFALSSPGDYTLKSERNGFYDEGLATLEIHASAYGAQYVQLKMDVRAIEQGSSGSRPPE
jgi:hypothetical protein